MNNKKAIIGICIFALVAIILLPQIIAVPIINDIFVQAGEAVYKVNGTNITNASILAMADYKLKDSKNNSIYAEINIIGKKVEVIPKSTPVKKIEFNNLTYNETIEIGIDDVPNEKEGKFVEVYAIDPTNIVFDNATVTAVAKGTMLYKCKDWNFTEQSCHGSWTKLMNIIPGQEYTFVLTAEDPGFAEINITAAEHLDSNYSFISDIFAEVERKDDNWSEPIYANEFIRVTFAHNLTNGSIINVYVRNQELKNTWFEIYHVNTTSPLLGKSKVFNSSGEWQDIILNNLSYQTNQFDFKIISTQGPITYLEFDYIHDAAPLSNFSGTFFEDWESASLATNNWTTSGIGRAWAIATDDPYAGIYYIETENTDGESIIETSISTANYKNITFSFWYDTDGLDAGEYLRADWYNGTTWINVLNITGTNTAAYTFDNNSLTPDANNNPNFKIRFRCYSSVPNEECKVDDIQIRGISIYPSFSDWEQIPSDLNASSGGDIQIKVNITGVTNITEAKLYYNNSGTAEQAGIIPEDPGYVNMSLIGGSLQNGRWCANISHWFYRPSKYNLFIKDLDKFNSTYEDIYVNRSVKINFTGLYVAENVSYRLEVYVVNKTGTVDDLDVYYCNSSYTAGDPLTNANCVYIGGLEPFDPTLPYGRKFLRFSINSNGTILSVKATPNMSIILEARDVSNISAAWELRRQNITLGTGHTYYSADNGTTWNLENNWEADAHIHWFDFANNQQFQYKVWANDSLGNNAYSTLQTDIWEQGRDPPTKPQITNPEYFKVYKGILNITWLASHDPNGDPFDYNVSLMTYDNGFLETINSSVPEGTEFQIYDTTSATDGKYKIKIEACDIYDRCSFDLMAYYFIIDNTKPTITINSPLDTFNTSSTEINFNWTATDNLDVGLRCNLTIDGIVNASNIISHNATATNYTVSGFSDGTHYWNITCWDDANNINTSETRSFTVDTTPPSFTSLSPNDNAVDGDGNIYFNCSVIDNLNLKNISFYFEGTLNKTVNISGTNTTAEFTLLNLSDGNYSWYCEVYDSLGHKNISLTRIVEVNREAVPNYSNFSGNTTDWASLPDLSNVCNSTAILDNPDTDMVIWHECVNAVDQDFDTAVKLSYNNVTITGLHSSFNSSATLYIRNLGWEDAPDVYINGEYCNASICSNVSYVNGTAIFNVSHFTSFTTAGNAKLVIWDETDKDMPYANQTKYVDEQIKFFANYTKVVNGNPILAAICTIDFADSSAIMIFNTTTELYEYNRSFAENGTFDYNVTCDSIGTELIKLTDNVTVNPKMISLINLTLNNYDENITIEAGLQVNITATLIIPSTGYIELYQNGVKIANGSSPLTIFMIYNETGIYNITAIYNGSRNYTPSYETHFIEVEDNTNPSVTNLTATPATINQTQTTNITVIVTDNTDISKVIVNITRADNITESYEMLEGINDVYYYEYTANNQNKAGIYYVRVIANDTSNNINDTETINFTVLDITKPVVEIIEPVENTIYDYNSVVPIKVNATDETQVDSVLANVSWDGNNRILKLNYNSTSLFYENVFDETSIITEYNITIIANDTSNNVNDTEKTSFEINDISPPAWSNITTDPVSPTTYSPNQSYIFYCTWTDNIKVNSVLFELNGENNTVTTKSGDKYYFTIQSLPAGNYSYKWYANDVYNNWNSTPLSEYMINKANSSINLTLDNLTENKTIEINTAVAIKAETITPPAGYLELYQDGALINNGTSPLENTTTYTELGVYNITAVYPTTRNYSSSSKTLLITVQDTQNPSVINITTTPGVINQTQTTNITVNVIDATNVTVKLNITKPDNITLTFDMIKSDNNVWYYTYTPTNQDPAGRYYIRIIARDASNNTNNTETDFFDVIDITAPSVIITAPLTNVTYNYNTPIAIKVNASDETAIDSVLANIEWADNDQLLELSYNSSSGLYEELFTDTTYLGRYNITIIVNDTSNNLNNTQKTYFNIADLSAPVYFNIRADPESPALLNETFFTLYATWTDNVNISKVILEFNGQNFTVTTKSGDVYYYTFTNLSVGEYNYRWLASDLYNNWNSTEYYNYKIRTEITPPTINYSIYPAAVMTGENITIDANATDNSNISTLWATITLPDSTTASITSFPLNYSTTINGRCDITFYANDTLGNLVNITDYFISNTGFEFTITVKDSNGNNVPVDLTLYITGTEKEVSNYQFNETLNSSQPILNYDLFFKAYNSSIKIKLNNVNLTKYNNKTLRIDKKQTPVTGYLATYAVESEFNQSNVTLTFNYSNIAFTNENYLSLYKCADWNFSQQECGGTWQYLSNVVQDKTEDTLTITLTNLSGFSIKQESYCGDGICDSGEDYNNCPVDCAAPAPSRAGKAGCSIKWNCTEWSECTENGTQTRICKDIACGLGNKTEIRSCNYTAPTLPEEIHPMEEIPKPHIEERPKLIAWISSAVNSVVDTIENNILWILITLVCISGSITIIVTVQRHKEEIIRVGHKMADKIEKFPGKLKIEIEKTIKPKDLVKEKEKIEELKEKIAKTRELEKEGKEFVISLETIKKKDEEKVTRLENEITKLEKDLKKLNERKQAIEDMTEDIRKIETKERKLKNKENKLLTLIKKDEELSKDIKTKIAATQDLLNDYKEHLKKLESIKKEKELVKAITNERIALLQTTIEKLSSQKSTLSNVRKEFEKDEQNFQIKKQGFVKLLKELYKRKEAKFSRFERAGVVIPDALKKKADAPLKNLEKKLKNLDLNIKLIINKIRKLKNKERVLALREQSKIRLLDKEKEELKNIQKECEVLDKKITASTFGIVENTKLLKKLENALTGIKKDLFKKKEKIEELKEKEKVIERQFVKLPKKEELSEKEESLTFKEKLELAVLNKKERDLKEFKKAVKDINKIETETIKKLKERIGKIEDYKKAEKEIEKDINVKKEIVKKIEERKELLAEKEAKKFVKDIIKDIEKLDEKTKKQIKKTKEYKQHLLNKLKEVYK